MDTIKKQADVTEQKTLRAPSETFSFPGAAALGWILRAFLVFLGAYAFVLFLGDATGVLYMGSGTPRDSVVIANKTAVFLTCAGATILCAAAAINRWTAFAVALLSVGGAYWFWMENRTLPRLIAQAFTCLYNHVLFNMAEDGYTVMAGYIVKTDYAYNERYLVTWALCIVAAVLVILLSIALMRRAHPIMLTLIVAGIAIPVFMYNITKTNTGTMCVIAFVAGAVALWMYDLAFGGIAESRERRAAKKAEKAAKKAEAEAQKKALREAASEAKIACFDAGGTKAEANAARKKVYADARLRAAAEKKAAREVKRAEKAAKKKPEPKAASPAEAAERRKELRAAARAARAVKRQVKGKSFRNIAAGGFAGTAAVIVAFLALAIPNAVIENNFPIIRALDNKIRVLRIYATAYLMGDDVDLNSLSLYGGVSELNPRTLSFDSPFFTGEKIFEVESGYNAPVYLRSWIGIDYDPETDTWISADSDTVLNYRALFGKDFTSDTIGANFKRYTYPLAVDLIRFDQYRGYSKYGFYVAQSNVRRVGGTSRLVFMPTYFFPTMGVMEHGSIEPNRYAVSNYFDGVYSSRFFATSGRAYSAYSFITTMKDPELGQTLEAQTEYFGVTPVYANELETLESMLRRSVPAVSEDGTVAVADAPAALSQPVEQFVARYEERMEAMGASWRGDSILRQYASMTDAERVDYKRAYTLEEAYRAYAYSIYRTPFGSEDVHDLAFDLLRRKGWKYDASLIDEDGNVSPEFVDSLYDPNSPGAHKVARHDLIMAVIEYLRRDDFTYTLNPEAPEGEFVSALDAFLFGSKQGYCVHFATAAAAILREYGLAVRYDEGYLAGGFQRTYVKEAVANYRTNVYDYNAHAWIEVYFPYMGWIQYEATPAYMSDMYDSGEGYSTTSSAPTTIGEEEPEEAEEPTEIELIEKKDYTALITLGVILGIVLVIAAIVLYLRHRAETSVRRRDALIAEARDEAAYFSGQRDNRDVSRRLNEAILRLFRLLGCAPENGELHIEYAERIDREYGALSRHPMSEVLPLIEKEEFGDGLDFSEMKIEAQYYEEMTQAVYRGLSLPRRFLMRCIYRSL